MTRCSTCHAYIKWAVLPEGQWVPIDRDPSPAGNIRFEPDGRAVVLGAVDAAAARLAGEDLYISHLATCPDAAGHRQRRRPTNE